MKITYCGIDPTNVKIFGEKTQIEHGQEFELPEEDALQLLNGYKDIFAPSLNTKLVKALKEKTKKKEEAKQEQIDKDIAERLIREEAEKKATINKLERQKLEKEVADKKAIKKKQSEIDDIARAKKVQEDKKAEMNAKMEEDKAIADERIEKIKKTLFSNTK